MSVKAAVAAFFCSHGGTPLFLYLSVNITIICIFSIPYFIYPLQCLFDFSPIFYVLVQMFSIFRALCHFACKGRYFFPGNFVKTALFSPFTGGEEVSLSSAPSNRRRRPLRRPAVSPSLSHPTEGDSAPSADLWPPSPPFRPAGGRQLLRQLAVSPSLSHPTEGDSAPSADLRPPPSSCPAGGGGPSANWRSPPCLTQRKGTALPLPACGPPLPLPARRGTAAPL